MERSNPCNMTNNQTLESRRKLLGLGATSAAASLAAILPATADAAVVSFRLEDPLTATVNPSQSSEYGYTIYWNPVSDFGVSLSSNSESKPDKTIGIKFYGYGDGNQVVIGAADNTGSLSNIHFDSPGWNTLAQAGTLFDSSSVNDSGICHVLKEGEGVTGYIGYSFDLVGGETHYGYAYVEVSGSTLTIRSWAYETTPDLGIIAGARESMNVPEPGTYALLLGGLLLGGLALKRIWQRFASK
ncbi:PEP-CTERM putative exosortase interaction domain-containing protein [Opitutaceae bacterium TAV1]|nr:PEP-CTERM putative exosortase interaction domain-containing protein [Opitutaceae bacterium TAV1]